MGIDAVMSVKLVQDEVKSFRVIAGLVLTPAELRHPHVAHCLRGLRR